MTLLNATKVKVRDEHFDSRRARLYWQCRRGMLELDIVLQAYMDHQYDYATITERLAFERLLSYPDPLLLEFIMGRMMPTDLALTKVVTHLLSTPP